MEVADLKHTFQYGMHGCGFYKGTNHVNSYEAMRYWRDYGVKVMEIDIAKTSDGKFVALAHLMNSHYLSMVEINSDGDSSYDKFSEKWFMSQRLCNITTDGLTPMNLDMIIRFMRDDPEVIIMFDLWRMWNRSDTYSFAEQLTIKANEDIKSRCIIEVYNRSMLAGIREANPELNIIYCVHGPKADEFEENVTPIELKSLGIDIISFPWASTKDFPGELENYHNEGFTIFSLYRDNRLNRKMRRLGVNVNLVDRLYTPCSYIKAIINKVLHKICVVSYRNIN